MHIALLRMAWLAPLLLSTVASVHRTDRNPDTRPCLAQSRGYSWIGDLEMSARNFRGALDAYQSAADLLTKLRDEHKLDVNGEPDLAHVRRAMAECARRLIRVS